MNKTIPHPWWRPDGVDQYVGVAVFLGGRVLLRRLDRNGYLWTFPRRKVGKEHVDTAYSNACTVTESCGVVLTRLVAVPGTWTGGASRAQYWRADVVRDKPWAEKSESERAWAPEPVPYADELSWVPVDDVAHLLAQTTLAIGRARDLAVWHGAQQAGLVVKPLLRETGWRPSCWLVHGERRVPFPSDALPGAFANAGKEPKEDLEQAHALVRAAATTGWRVEACYACRHVKWSGMAKEHGGAWCTACREPDDERRAAVDDALGWCPRFEESMFWRPGLDDAGNATGDGV